MTQLELTLEELKFVREAVSLHFDVTGISEIIENKIQNAFIVAFVNGENWAHQKEEVDRDDETE
jgi:hypothetical protein